PRSVLTRGRRLTCAQGLSWRSGAELALRAGLRSADAARAGVAGRRDLHDGLDRRGADGGEAQRDGAQAVALLEAFGVGLAAKRPADPVGGDRGAGGDREVRAKR